MKAFNNTFAAVRLRQIVLAGVLVIALSACGGSEDGGTTPPPAPAPQNVAPSLSGSPATTGTVGVAYSFQPAAQDPEGATLGFSIQNKPAWATFSTATGQLSGTPTAAGVASNIVISVSDGTNTTALAAFTLTVSASAPPPATGSVSLSWTAPTQNSDGSSLTDLAGFRVYYGTSATALTANVGVPGAGTLTHNVTGLAAGTWYFSVAAYATSGAESTLSNPVSATVP